MSQNDKKTIIVDKNALPAEAVNQKQVETVAKMEKKPEKQSEKQEKPVEPKKVQAAVKAAGVPQQVRTQLEEKITPAPRKKSKKGSFIGLAVAAIVLAAGMIAYGSVAIHYQTCFLPGTYINELDCSEMEVAQVAALLQEQSTQGYELEILGRTDDGSIGVLGTITAKDVEMELEDGLLSVQALFDQQNPLLWIGSVGKKEVKHTLTPKLRYSEDKLTDLVESMDFMQEESGVAVSDAYLSEYSEELGGYEIIPEVTGNQLDRERALQVINEAVNSKANQVNLEEAGCYLAPQVTAENEELVALRDTLNLWLSTQITYDWVGREVVLDRKLLQDWIYVENGEAILDEGQVADFVSANARKYDNYGKNRDFITSQGVQLNLPSGAFGWKTDQDKEIEELTALIKEGAVTKREPVYSSKAPRKDGNNIGSSYVEIDLTNQHLYLYKDGVLSHEANFVSGLMTDSECITPQGVFRITYKTTNATLRGGDYAEFVHYWMPFHGNYGMHDATWRTEFGGTIYLTDGSHGCINLPLGDAEIIYNYMYDGYPVICYYY